MGSGEGSMIVLARVSNRAVAYVADDDESVVHAVDVANQTILSRTVLPGRPAQMVIAPEGTLRVTLRDDHAVLSLGATEDLRAPLVVGARIETAREPLSLAIAGSRLLVLSGAGHTLEAFDLATEARALAVDLAREPRALIASNDGARAFVSHAGAGHVSVVDLAKPDNVNKVDVGMAGWTETRGFRSHNARHIGSGLKTGGLAHEGDEPPRMMCGTGMMMSQTVFPSRHARQGFALAKLTIGPSERIFIPHVAVATGDALSISSGYGGSSEEAESLPSELFDVDVIESASAKKITGPAGSVPVDARIGATACRLPRAAVADPKRQTLLVSCIGNAKLIEYDGRTNAPMAKVKRVSNVPPGALGLALDEERDQAIVWSQYDRAIAFVSRAELKKGEAPKQPSLLSIPRGETFTLSDAAVLGRKLFHASAEPKIARDGRACASCHPDGRDDGLTWSTPEGPRQTITLAGRVTHQSPFGWRGQHATLKEHMVHTMKNLGGTGLRDEEHEALSAYLRSLRGPPPVERTLTDAEMRGKYVFNDQAGCAGCHAEKTRFTDHDVHNVQSATSADRQASFITPSLVRIGESAPYFHDGRYATLGDLLRKSDGKMGNTGHLSAADLDALEAYLRTL